MNPHQNGTVKDAHSPSGQSFYVPANYADLPDCPVCKWGTPQDFNKTHMKCIDCGAVVPKPEPKQPK